MESVTLGSRVVLFDIDGTLLHAGPVPRRAFAEALREVFGTAGTVDAHPFAGKTDPQIAREILLAAGVGDEAISVGLPALLRAYLHRLEQGLLDPAARPRVLPGVPALLDALGARADCVVGLLTGNVARGAALKLEAVGIGGRFAFGAYGSDSPHRPDLARVALGRVAALGLRAGPAVVVGDTPLDVACGAAAGARTVAVATGAFSASRLAAAGADVVLPDLSDTARSVEAIVGDR
jgi:phosphoglycolate phosphatase-like HAD superfamily hydrolase